MHCKVLPRLLLKLPGRSILRSTLVVLAGAVLAVGILLASSTQAAVAPRSAAPITAAPGTADRLLQDGDDPAAAPAANADEAQSARRGSPILGIVVLLAPFVFLIWKSRGKKSAEIKSAACLPVIDESKRPFALDQDEGEGTKKPKG